MEASIKENEHTNKIEDIYKDLSPASQTTLQNQFNNLEKKLNEETYLKTQITQNKNTIKKVITHALRKLQSLSYPAS